MCAIRGLYLIKLSLRNDASVENKRKISLAKDKIRVVE
jgi:hypothetical protein